MTTPKIREAIVGDMVKVIQTSVLAAYLLQMKKTNAPTFTHYIHTLPATVDHFPEMFSEDDLKWLEGSCALPKYNDHKSKLIGHHKIFTEMCSEFTFTFEEYVWAMKTC